MNLTPSIQKVLALLVLSVLFIDCSCQQPSAGVGNLPAGLEQELTSLLTGGNPAQALEKAVGSFAPLTIIEKLIGIGGGAHLNQPNEQGHTPLTAALTQLASTPHPDQQEHLMSVVEALLKGGADPNVPVTTKETQQSMTALDHLNSYKGDLSSGIVNSLEQLLLGHGAQTSQPVR